MRLRAKTTEPCPDCKTNEVDVVVECKDSGKSDAFVRCVECDRLIVLRGVTVSVPDFGLAGIEGEESVEVERLDGAIVDAVMNVAEMSENDKLIESLKKATRAFGELAKAGAKLKVVKADSNFKPPPKSSPPPRGFDIRGRGGQNFFYRGGGNR